MRMIMPLRAAPRAPGDAEQSLHISNPVPPPPVPPQRLSGTITGERKRVSTNEIPMFFNQTLPSPPKTAHKKNVNPLPPAPVPAHAAATYRATSPEKQSQEHHGIPLRTVIIAVAISAAVVVLVLGLGLGLGLRHGSTQPDAVLNSATGGIYSPEEQTVTLNPESSQQQQQQQQSTAVLMAAVNQSEIVLNNAAMIQQNTRGSLAAQLGLNISSSSSSSSNNTGRRLLQGTADDEMLMTVFEGRCASVLGLQNITCRLVLFVMPGASEVQAADRKSVV